MTEPVFGYDIISVIIKKADTLELFNWILNKRCYSIVQKEVEEIYTTLKDICGLRLIASKKYVTKNIVIRNKTSTHKICRARVFHNKLYYFCNDIYSYDDAYTYIEDGYIFHVSSKGCDCIAQIPEKYTIRGVIFSGDAIYIYYNGKKMQLTQDWLVKYGMHTTDYISHIVNTPYIIYSESTKPYQKLLNIDTGKWVYMGTYMPAVCGPYIFLIPSIAIYDSVKYLSRPSKVPYKYIEGDKILRISGKVEEFFYKKFIPEYNALLAPKLYKEFLTEEMLRADRVVIEGGYIITHKDGYMKIYKPNP